MEKIERYPYPKKPKKTEIINCPYCKFPPPNHATDCIKRRILEKKKENNKEKNNRNIENIKS